MTMVWSRNRFLTISSSSLTGGAIRPIAYGVYPHGNNPTCRLIPTRRPIQAHGGYHMLSDLSVSPDTVVDTVVATGAVTSPWWLIYFEAGNHIVLMVGGLILLVLRIGVAWREYKRKGRG